MVRSRTVVITTTMTTTEVATELCLAYHCSYIPVTRYRYPGHPESNPAKTPSHSFVQAEVQRAELLVQATETSSQLQQPAGTQPKCILSNTRHDGCYQSHHRCVRDVDIQA